jgi:D-lyxose ketol-isomerase
VEFDGRKVTLDAGVPIRFSIGQEICAVPATSTIPSFLKDTRFYIAP